MSVDIGELHFGQIERGKRLTAVECLSSDIGNGRRNIDILQRYAVDECITLNVLKLAALCEDNGLQLLEASECRAHIAGAVRVVTDRLNGRRNGDRGYVVGKCAVFVIVVSKTGNGIEEVADLLNTLLEVDLLKRGTSADNVVRNKLNACAEGHALKIYTVKEVRILACSKVQVIGKNDALKLGSVECKGSQEFQLTVALVSKYDPLEIAVCESVLIDACNGRRNGNEGNGGITECVLSDGHNALGNDEAIGNGIRECALTDSDDGIGNYVAGKISGSAVDDLTLGIVNYTELVNVEIGVSFGNDNNGRGQLIERLTGEDISRVVNGQSKLFKRGIGECRVDHTGNGCRKHHLLHYGVVVERIAERGQLRLGKIDRLKCGVAECVTVDQGKLGELSEINVTKSVTLVERILVDLSQRKILKVDVGKRSTVLEQICGDLGHCALSFTVKLEGNGGKRGTLIEYTGRGCREDRARIVRGNGKRGNTGKLECLGSDAGNILTESYGSKRGTVSECGIANLRNVITEGNGGQRSAAVKRILTDLRNLSGNIEGGKSGTALEGRLGDNGKAGRNINVQSSQMSTLVEHVGCTGRPGNSSGNVESYSVTGCKSVLGKLDVSRTLTEVDSYNGSLGAVSECEAHQLLQVRRKIDGGNSAVCAAYGSVGNRSSGVVTDGKKLLLVVSVIGSKLLEGYGVNSGIAKECLAEYNGNGIGNGYGVGRLTVNVGTLVCERTEDKSLHINSVKDTVLRSKLSTLDAIVKVVIDINGLKRKVSGEHSSYGRYGGRGKCRSNSITKLIGSCGECNACKLGVVSKCGSSDIKRRSTESLEDDLLKATGNSRAGHSECAVTDLGNGLRNNDRGESGALVKCVLLNSSKVRIGGIGYRSVIFGLGYGSEGNGGKSGTLVEGVLTYKGRTCRDLNGLKSGTLGEYSGSGGGCVGTDSNGAGALKDNGLKRLARIECALADSSNALRNGEGHQSTLLECAYTDSSSIVGKNDLGKIGTSGKRLASDGKSGSALGYEADLLKIFAVSECGITDSGNGCGNSNALKEGVGSKCGASDGNESVGKVIDNTAHLSCKSLRIEEKLGRSIGILGLLLIKNAVCVVQILLVGIVYGNALKCIASLEGDRLELGKVIGKIYTAKLGTLVECIICKGKSGRSLGSKGKLNQIRAVVECILTDLGSGCGNVEMHNCRAISEGILVKLSNGCLVGDIDIAKLGLHIECILTNYGDINALFDIDSAKSLRLAGAGGKCTLANGDNTGVESIGAVALEGNGLKSSVISEGIGADGKIRASGILEGNGLYAVASVECSFTDGGYPHRNGYGGDKLTSVECLCADSGNTGRNGNVACKACGTVYKSLVAVGKEAANGSVVFCALLDLDELQTGKAGKHGGHGSEIKVNVCGKLDRLNGSTVLECVSVYFNRIGSTVCELDGLQLIAVVERILGNRNDVIGDNDRRNIGIVECLSGDLLNVGRNGVATGHSSRNYLKISSTVVLTDKNTVIVGEEGLILALFLGICYVYVDVLKIRAAVKRTCTDHGNGIGNAYADQLGALAECALENSGNGDLVIGNGNGKVGNVCNSLTLGNRVSTVGLKSKGQRIGTVVRINGNISGERIRSNGSTGLIGKLNTCTGSAGVPACEVVDAGILSNGNGKREVLGVGCGNHGTVLNVGNIEIIGLKSQVVGLGSPLCVYYGVGITVEYGALCVELTVAGSALGSIVPSGEIITVVGKALGGKSHNVTDCKILDKNVSAAYGAGIVLNCNGIYGNGYPIGYGILVNVSYLDKVLTFLGELYLCVGNVGHVNGSAAVNSYLILIGSENGRPVYGILRIGNDAIHSEVAYVNGLGVRGANVICIDSLYLDLVDLALRQSDGGIGEAELIGVNGNGLGTDLDLIGNSAVYCVPGDNAADSGDTGGSRRSGLGIGYLSRDGRVVAVSNGADGYLHSAGVAGSVEACKITVINGNGLAADGNGHYVGSRVVNGIPYEAVGSGIIAESFDCAKNLVVLKGLGNRGGVAVSACSNGNKNTALLHIAVSNIINGRRTVVKCGVSMTVVTAINSDEILFGKVNCAENENAVINKEIGYSVQGLVCVVSYGRLGVVLRISRNRNHADLVLSCRIVSEGESLGGSANRLVIDQSSSVGSNYSELIGSGVLNGIPANGIAVNADSRSGQLGISIIVPYRIESGVLGEHGAVGIFIGKLFTVSIHTDPPSAEGVAFSLGSGDTVCDAGNGFDGSNSLSATVAELEINRVLGSEGSLLCPLCVNNSVSLDSFGIKGVGGGERFIGIPTEEDRIFFDRVSGLGSGLAVYNGNGIDLRSAVYVKAYGVIYLLNKGKISVVVNEAQSVATESYGSSSILVLEEIKGDGTVLVHGVRTGFV